MIVTRYAAHIISSLKVRSELASFSFRRQKAQWSDSGVQLNGAYQISTVGSFVFSVAVGSMNVNHVKALMELICPAPFLRSDCGFVFCFCASRGLSQRLAKLSGFSVANHRMHRIFATLVFLRAPLDVTT